MGCGVDVDGRNFCRCLISIRLLAHPVVSFQIIQDSLLVAGGSTSIYSYCFCQRSGMLYNC